MPGGWGDSDDSMLKSPPPGIKTPKTVPPPQPARHEMHPSKAHRSTTEEPDSALRLGFADMKDDKGNAAAKALADTPSKIIAEAPSAAEDLNAKGPSIDTPSKSATELKSTSFGTPSKSTAELKTANFEFKWARQENDLSSEAQRIMDSVREEAARIKTKMQAQRDEQLRRDLEASLTSPTTGRRISTPRRGRFSDAHRAEFSKMDSIANHVSLLRDRANATGETPKISIGQTLKRTKSRAELDEHPVASDSPANPRAGKRIRTSIREEVPVAAEAHKVSPPKTTARGIPSTLHTPSKLPAAASTPTKASIARATSMRSIRTASKLPVMLRSRTTKALASSPISSLAPKSEGSNKYFAALARAPSMKSILHRPQPKYSSDPVKIAAGTHLPMDKVDEQPAYPQLGGKSPVKRVEFDLGEDSKDEPESPSRIPVGVHIHHTPSKLGGTVSYPQLSPTKAEHTSDVSPSAAADFTFRSPQPIKFRSAPTTPARVHKSGLPVSPSRPLGLAASARRPVPAAAKKTIRHVRPSGVSTPLTPFSGLAGIPHGMPNKKRRRADDEDEENEDPTVGGGKRVKMSSSPKRASLAAKDAKTLDAVERRRKGSVSPKKKPFLSMSRLNALARPKSRG